jgi:hypothetical protein
MHPWWGRQDPDTKALLGHIYQVFLYSFANSDE